MSLDWGVQLARLTLFLNDPHSISDKDWSVVTGQEEAETRQAIPGGKRLSGTVPTGTLHMSATGSRFDVILTVAEIDEGEDVTLPSVGSIDETFKTFFESTCKWIEEFKPSVIRIAFGAVLTCKAESREEAYTHLKGLFRSLKVDPAKMQDLQYRVNWPATSNVEQGLVLNRLTSWSAMRVFRKLLQIGPEDVSDGGEIKLLNGVRLEVDNNTDVTRKAPFEPGNVIPIYSELVELARQNAVEGEVPCP